MAAFALQARDVYSDRVVSTTLPGFNGRYSMRRGMHPSTGSGRCQVCGRLYDVTGQTGGNGFLMAAFACRVRTRQPAQVVENRGLGVLPLRLELRGRGQRHLLLPSTRSVTLGGRIGKRRNSHVTWCLLSHGLGISSFQRPGTLLLVRVVLTAHPRSPIACGRQADILLWCHWLNPR